MEYFKKYFKDVDNWEQEEVKVLCPFHNDTNPSASINTSNSLFHCWVCDIGYNEEQFVARVNNISKTDAIKLLDKYNSYDKWETHKGLLWADTDFLEKVKKLGFSENLIEEMQLGLIKDENNLSRKYLGIPVYYNNILVDIRRYNINKYENVPKMMSNAGAISGWVIPYDKFLNSNNTCYLFEGEKDMLMAREVGINAYTLTGGANASPNDYVINAFKDKDIVLCYDNDNAGKNGMINIYKSVKHLVNSIKYINISEVVKEEKEDFYDYINKYNGNIFEFYSLNLYDFNVEEDKEKLDTIKNALSESLLKRDLKSIVTVTGEFSDPYSVPTIIECEKLQDSGTKLDTLFKGEKRYWYLEKNNMNEMLELIEVNAKNIEVTNKAKAFMGISSKEPFIETRFKDAKTVFKSIISDKDNDGSSVNLDIYSFVKLNVGEQYEIKYRIYPHPTKNQKLIAVAFEVNLINNNDNYKLNKDKLKQFKIDGSVSDKLKYLYESAKHHIAKHLNFDIWLMTDLVFNSILDFKYGEEMRGVLDVFFLGDTQVGKSETTSKMVELYNFGHFLSLKTSTTTGLIGGSNKIDGSYCNTIGAIPRQHKRLVILEEFSGAKPDFIKTMTDIRSSNELRISRVSGELVVPCKLRMITISNPINDENGNPRFLNTFPNGVMPIMELIKSAEDVSRYDGFLLIPKVERRFNPFEFNLTGTPIPKSCYEEKAKWVMTRTSDNVMFADGVESYIWEKAESLNDEFECNFPLFGTTTSKKLARFCVALSSLIMSVDDSYENIIVTKDIVDFIVEYLTKIYTSNTFKLKEYADDYKSYSQYNEEDIKNLQSIYSNNSTIIDFISTQNKTTRSNLLSISGIEGNKFSILFNKLVHYKLIRLNGDNVYPTDKFRKVYNLINKDFKTDIGNKIDQVSGVEFINDLI